MQVSGQEDKSILEIILTRNYKYWFQKHNGVRHSPVTLGYFWGLENPYAWNQTDTRVDIPPHFWEADYNRKGELVVRDGASRCIRVEFDWTKHVGPAHA